MMDQFRRKNKNTVGNFCFVSPISLANGAPSQLMKTNIEETYDSGDHSNQIPIIRIADKLQKEHVLVYNRQQHKWCNNTNCVNTLFYADYMHWMMEHLVLGTPREQGLEQEVHTCLSTFKSINTIISQPFKIIIQKTKFVKKGKEQ